MTAVRWVKFWIGDYLNDTRHLTTTQHGAYLLLLFHYYRHGGLPKRAVSLANIAKLSRGQWARVRPVVMAFFDSDLRHKRCERELQHIEKQRNARQRALDVPVSPMISKARARSKAQKKNLSSKVTVCAEDAKRFLEICIAAGVDPKTIPDAPRGKTAKRSANGSTRTRSRKPSTTQPEDQA